jgi:hypothetical protein
MEAPYGAIPATTVMAAPYGAYGAAPAVTMEAPYGAIPATTVMAAPYTPPTYAAAPAVVQTPSYVAAPVTMEAFPSATVVAAPAYAAAPAVVQTPSYVPAPVMPQGTVMQVPTQKASFVAPPAMPPMVQQQFAVAARAPPSVPMKLTEGIPDPQSIEAQKKAYSAALDKQLKEAADTVAKETAIEKQMVEFKIKKDIAMHDLAVDEQLTEQLALVDEQATQAQCQLKKALVDRNVQLNSQASSLVADYKMKAMMDDLNRKKVEFEKAYVSNEMVMAQQYGQQVAMANTPTIAYAAPPGAVRGVA